MKTNIFLVCLAWCIAQPANAGSPTQEQVTCPIGDEVFEITTTTSCSTMGRFMSMRSATSCDFVTRIPICPSNGLPLYRDFSDLELADLRRFIETPEFAEMRDKPPYQVAYGVAHHLGDTISEQGFSLALGGWWFEPDAFIANPRFQDSFLREAEAELSRASAEDAPYLAGLTAFAMAHAGRGDFARNWLMEANQRLKADATGQSYVAAVSACLPDVTAQGCSTNDLFSP